MINDYNINNISWEQFFHMDSVHSCRTAYSLPCENCEFYSTCSKLGINKTNFFDKFADRYNKVK